MQLDLIRQQHNSRDSAFDYDKKFRYAWDSMPSNDDSAFIYSALRDGHEVARALVLTKPLRLTGYTAPADQLVTELEHIEVRSGRRRQGIGRALLGELVRRHGRLYALSSAEAVQFYRSLEWHEFRRAEGHSPANAELFVSPAPQTKCRDRPQPTLTG
ncbi:GNAT family N-acetyltransferase [Microbacterium trichothecenolyticum]|uniref:GNAT family N-acetyltransferase n=1 Tax=Microbacterium trichothecenolyticum TaxID=69370 RepID=UPI00146FD2E1|nr:GNAT family N-acetyltransferase [Microbacterium trichothecenolyticum]